MWIIAYNAIIKPRSSGDIFLRIQATAFYILTTAFYILMSTVLVAEEDDLFGITMYGSFLHTEKVPDALFFFNDIEQYDSFEFRRALRNHDVDTVVLGSNGGNVFEALNMAAIINDNKISTYVPKLPNGLGCYSACSYMFFGGRHRRADGVLAVHQAGSYEPELDSAKQKVGETQQQTQFTVSEIIGFLNEFETPAFVYEKMFRSRDFYVFNQKEIQALSSGLDELNLARIKPIDRFIKNFFLYLDEISKEKNANTSLGQPENKDREATVKEIEQNEDEQLTFFVMDIQKMLNSAGCDAGLADGIWGRRTQDAVILFAKTAKIKVSDAEPISKILIDALRSAPANFCPKAEIIKRNKVTTELSKYWFDKYYYSCSRAKNMRGDMVMNLSSKKSLLEWTLYYPSGGKFKGSMTNPTTETVKILFGKNPKTLKLKRSKNGKVESFTYYWLTNGTCTGSAY